MFNRTSSFLMIIILALTGYATAEIITVNVTGVVDSLTPYGNFTFKGNIDVGSIMTGFCTYDTDTPDNDTSTDYYGHYYIDALSMSIEEYSFIHESIGFYPEFQVWRTDITYKASTEYATKYYNQTQQGTSVADVTLLDLCNASVSGPDDHLPTSFPDISFFTYRNEFSASSLSYGNGFTITGHLTSIQAVPEPTTFLLLGLGIINLRKRK